MLRIALRQPRRSLLETLIYRQYDDPFPHNFAGRTRFWSLDFLLPRGLIQPVRSKSFHSGRQQPGSTKVRVQSFVTGRQRRVAYR